MIKKCLNVMLSVALVVSQTQVVLAQQVFLPATQIEATTSYQPLMLEGIKVDPENGMKLGFVFDMGDDQYDIDGQDLRFETSQLVKYFLAALTIPEKDLWVNLSPFEQDRIMSESLSQTAMGRDLLAQDYLLKQFTSSLMSPDHELGEMFWGRVYDKFFEQYGHTDFPSESFHKVWIMPETATVYESGYDAYLTERHLKVMLEEDFFALQKSNEGKNETDAATDVSQVSSEIMRQVIIPEIEREVNEGKHFAKLRQIYNAMIFATWYKQRLKESILGKVYSDQSKITGIDVFDSGVTDEIYNEYVDAFREGVGHVLREEYDPVKEEIVVKNYFSGGIGFDSGKMSVKDDRASLATEPSISSGSKFVADVSFRSLGKNYEITNPEIQIDSASLHSGQNLFAGEGEDNLQLAQANQIQGTAVEGYQTKLESLSTFYQQISEKYEIAFSQSFGAPTLINGNTIYIDIKLLDALDQNLWKNNSDALVLKALNLRHKKSEGTQTEAQQETKHAIEFLFQMSLLDDSYEIAKQLQEQIKTDYLFDYIFRSVYQIIYGEDKFLIVNDFFKLLPTITKKEDGQDIAKAFWASYSLERANMVLSPTTAGKFSAQEIHEAFGLLVKDDEEEAFKKLEDVLMSRNISLPERRKYLEATWNHPGEQYDLNLKYFQVDDMREDLLNVLKRREEVRNLANGVIEFKPIFIKKPWGTEKHLKQIMGESPDGDKYGEVWGVSGLKAELSDYRLQDGTYISIQDIINVAGKDNVIGTQKSEVTEQITAPFPITAKHLSVGEIPISLQVHPNHEEAHELLRINGQDELYYITRSGYLYLGWKDGVNEEEILEAMELAKTQGADKVLDLMNKVQVETGDVYYTAAGAPHTMLNVGMVEFKQSSTLTWRYADPAGRTVHPELGLVVTDLTQPTGKAYVKNAKQEPELFYADDGKSVTKFVQTDHLTLYRMDISSGKTIDFEKMTHRFDMFTSVKGDAVIKVAGQPDHVLKQGYSIVIPANVEFYSIENASEGDDLQIVQSYAPFSEIDEPIIVGFNDNAMITTTFVTDVDDVVVETKNGGITLDAAMLDMQIIRDEEGVPLSFELQPFEQMNVQGIIPVIESIQWLNKPATSPRPFSPLGQSEKTAVDQLTADHKKWIFSC